MPKQVTGQLLLAACRLQQNLHARKARAECPREMVPGVIPCSEFIPAKGSSWSLRGFQSTQGPAFVGQASFSGSC